MTNDEKRYTVISEKLTVIEAWVFANEIKRKIDGVEIIEAY